MIKKLALVWTPVDDQEMREQHYYSLKPGYGLRWVVTVCIWWPSLRMVPLGRHSTQCHSEWETNLCETEGKGNIQPFFFSLQAGFWPTLSPSPTAVVQNRGKHCCVEHHDCALHSDCVRLWFLCVTVFCRHFFVILHYRHQEHWRLPCVCWSWCLAELENATLGCSFPRRSGGMLQLSHIPTA